MMKNVKLISSLFLMIAVIAVAAFTGCDDNQTTDEPITFKFEMVDKDENITSWDITATQTNHDGKQVSTPSVGEVLREEGIIEEKGLINTVNGITLDWETDKAYWEFQVDGVYSMTGVDDTSVKEGVVYAFVYTKG